MPWPGVTWKVSYDGPLRATDSPGWEYVLEMDAGQATPQTFSPPSLFWLYGLTFVQPEAQPCPPYAFEPYG